MLQPSPVDDTDGAIFAFVNEGIKILGRLSNIQNVH